MDSSHAAALDGAPPDAAIRHDHDIPDLSAFARPAGQGMWTLDLMVDGVHCGGCVAKIERRFSDTPGVTSARVNLTTHRLALAWAGSAEDGNHHAAAVTALGFPVAPFHPEAVDAAGERSDRRLLRALAVSGFAAGNIMLLSVAVWAGAVQDMGPATRGLLHWISALIAVPAVVYGGAPFFRSAYAAIRGGHVNMDVPISAAVLLTLGMSLVETATGGDHVYFESAVMLLFFLLVGRTLDQRVRRRAHNAAAHMLALQSRPVTVIEYGGRHRNVPADQVLQGALVHVAPGERIGVDGTIVSGASTIDESLISGESLPKNAAPGSKVFAGMVNLDAAVTVRADRVGEGTLLAEIVQLMEAAETGRAAYRTISERIVRLYAPVVHGVALLTFVGWIVLGGIAWQTALLYAVAVLIVTCPCALALAAPVVQVLATGNLLKVGILLKSPSALERFAEIDTVVFDKTGTLTRGRPVLVNSDAVDPDVLRRAASICAASRHPLARAICRAAPEAGSVGGVFEQPGKGLRAISPLGEVRVGTRAWCGIEDDTTDAAQGPEVWMAGPGHAPVCFRFEDELRADASETVLRLRHFGLDVALLSGDRPAVTSEIACRAGIADWTAAVNPAGKVQHLERMHASGKKVLMVGDGLNDAPALAAAHVSLSPSSAADVSQTAADAVFQGGNLGAVVAVVCTARESARIVSQNLGFAFAYNAVMIPVAVAGLVTPLIAAAAMSLSSLSVVANALRVPRPGHARKPRS